MSDLVGTGPGEQLGGDSLDERVSALRVLGEGELPEELDCFNWTAHFFPWFWSAFYGVWWPYLILAAQYLVGPGLRLAFPDVFTSWVTYSYLRAGWSVVMCGFIVWFGVNANRMAWRAAKRRGPEVLTRTVDGLGYGQRVVFVVGVTLMLASWAAAVLFALRTPQHVLAIRVSANVILAANLISLGTAVYLSKTSRGWLWRVLALRES